VKFRKLSFVGLSNKYQGKVRGNPEDTEMIRAFVGTYSPSVYAYYSSYAQAAIQEEKRSHSVFRSARVAVGIAAGLFALVLMLWRPWSSLEKGIMKPGSVPGTGAFGTSPSGAPSSVPPAPFGVVSANASVSVQKKIRIVGGGGVPDGESDQEKWRYLLESGELLTAAQISGRYGVTVHEEEDHGILRLVGEGIEYGPGRD
jgi:hypothetical protein